MNLSDALGIMEGIIEPDPYLQYQPNFAYTLPIQLLVNGITFTLLCVLLIHLLFTTQYHYPLAPLNYILQLLSILTVLISVIIKIVVILQHSAKSADTWPYDLDYVAVSIPPPNWNTGKCAAWFFLQALNNGLSNITHIQFLTMLYPSRTEARLIMFVLGPLAIASSVLVFSALSPHQTVLDISDAIRNVFNSTLLLIFTISLVIWGFFVNRRRAWRFDGGTAVFGFGSLLLAAISTSFNFVAVAEDGIDWLQHLLFAAVLWQIWLGWWWWVGSGMGIGEVEDIMERAERKKRKAAKAASRARSAASGSGAANNANGANRLRATSLSGIADNFTSGVTSILKTSTRVASHASGTLTRRNTARDRDRENNDEHLAESGAIELDDLNQNQNRSTHQQQQHVEFDPIALGNENEGSLTNSHSRARAGQTSTTSETSSTSATPSLHTPKNLSQLLSFPTTLLVIYLRKLRKAHEEATKQQALARAERRQRVFHEASPPPQSREGSRRNSTNPNANAIRYERGIEEGGVDDIGWGLGRFGIREHEESARRLRQAGERLNEERLLGGTAGGNGNENEPSGSRRGSRSRSREDSPSQVQVQVQESDVPQRLKKVENSRDQSERLQVQSQTQVSGQEEGEWEDIDSSNSSSDVNARNRNRRRNRLTRGNNQDNNGNRNDDTRAGSGWSWWGPLRDWRLNDRSAF
ncbi:hypothetical protein L486_05109 [Kwoniella mangroviensis CBS 10435]|uniref:Uncharacterized protein n=1 Tax=Kwoniella mangroviensis CBS 10435 TaxID=1331196 RepID=A0A1B9IQ42_9TREE|nr:uncharacterized protein I203_00155 [Kwoniella mangroviensis CBS 8507]OCF57647.1 hypothetical protein L486_05109 [Kwoniella mangroviensis CBS 10435]OCF70026.1 hypothetical protein I203_00155 [Kwoniella mangroviensis CBS 8507]